MGDGLRITRTDPRCDEARALVAELDAYLGTLYSPEDNHLVPVEELAGPGAVFLLALDGDRAVGCGAIRLYDGYAELKRMYVRPEMRGRHVALRLLQRLEEEALALGQPLVRLETGPQQKEAVALYERQGFTRCERFGDYPSCGGSLFMEKRLHAPA